MRLIPPSSCSPPRLPSRTRRRPHAQRERRPLMCFPGQCARRRPVGNASRGSGRIGPRLAGACRGWRWLGRQGPIALALASNGLETGARRDSGALAGSIPRRPVGPGIEPCFCCHRRGRTARAGRRLGRQTRSCCFQLEPRRSRRH